MEHHKVACKEGDYGILRVLVFATYFHPHVGGYEENVRALYRRLISRGYVVSVVTCNTNNVPTLEDIDGIQVYRLPCWHMLGGTYPVPKPSRMAYRMVRTLWRQDWDIVNTQTRFFITSFMGALFAKLRRIPLIHTERGTRHSMVTSRMVGMLARMYDHTAGSFVVRVADCCVGVSSVACKFVEHLGGQRPLRIPNGLDMDCWEVKEERHTLGKRLIVFVGRLIYAKGVQDLINVLPMIRVRHSDAELVIVGDGNYRGELEVMAIGQPIWFYGQRKQPQVAEILRGADVFVNPSYSEGLPTSVMEAAAVGLPIVATDVGGTNEIIQTDKNGILVKPGDRGGLALAIMSILQSPEKAARYGEAARETVGESYGWDAVVGSYDELFASLVRRQA